MPGAHQFKVLGSFRYSRSLQALESPWLEGPILRLRSKGVLPEVAIVSTRASKDGGAGYLSARLDEGRF